MRAIPGGNDDGNGGGCCDGEDETTGDESGEAGDETEAM